MAYPDPVFGGRNPPYDWNQTQISFDHENRSYVEVYDDVEQGGEPGDGAPLDPQLTELDTFLHIPRGSARADYQRPVLEKMCPSETLRGLRVRRDATCSCHRSKILAWIDDRSVAGERRHSNGFKTVGALYEALSAKRFVAPSDSQGEDADPSADRRLIYIPNPDAWPLAAIILRASPSQALFLPDFLWKHWKAYRSILATTTLDLKFFCLEFHLSFFVLLRSSSAIRKDARASWNGTPLRESIDLGFLTSPEVETAPGRLNDYLYEAQASTMVTGHSKSIYTAYCLIDTYFVEEGEEEKDRDSLRYYMTEAEELDGTHLDPLTLGRSTVELPIWDARHYFLFILNARVECLKEEWINLITFLQDKINCFITGPAIPPSPSTPTIGSAEVHSRSVHRSYQWLNSVSSLLTRLIKTLSDTLEEWQRFKQDSLGYFSSPDAAENAKGATSGPRHQGRCKEMFHSTERCFRELSNYLRDLVYLNEQQTTFREQLNLYFTVENNRAIVLQYWNVTFMHFASPPALAAAMLQSQCIPFDSPWGSFLFLTAIFAAATWGIQPALTWYYRRQQAIGIVPQVHASVEGQQTSTSEFKYTIPAPVFAFPQPTFASQGTDNFPSVFRKGQAVPASKSF